MPLRVAAEEVQNVILNNLSKRLAVMIKEDMEIYGTCSYEGCLKRHSRMIVNIIRKLEDSAEIVIARGGGDEIIV